MREYLLYSNGEFAESVTKQTFDSINPFNQEIVARVARAGPADAQKAIAAARKAFDQGPWPKMSREERSAMIKAISDKINEKKVELTALEVEDSGSTVRKAQEDIYLSARNMHYFSKLASTDLSEQIEGLSRPGFSQNMIVREPVGVVSAIIPWNFPLKMAIWKLGPALAAGNTIVLKPSELTPVTAMELAKIIHEIGFPPGVVNIIPGFGEDAGEEMVRNPMVDKVAFTGSTAVGKRVMALAANTLKKCTLECGGKSANIVLEDADMDLAVDGALYAIFYHQGQCCEAGTRLFLPEKIHDEFLHRMVEKTKRMKVGDPKDAKTDIGPLISKKQRERVMSYIKSGVEQGAKMVLSVMKYKTVDDAIALANDSIYGLGGGVWSRDKEKAMTVAKQLRAGTVWINEWHLLSEKAPFGGYRQSGIGREFGLDGLKEYTETKHLHIDELGSREKKFWYDTVVPKNQQ